MTVVSKPVVAVEKVKKNENRPKMNCHQCRQQMMDLTVGCKNMKGNKQCVMRFCHKCLLKRYGEKAEEIKALDNWNCPKCRDICNCSHCMKKWGLKPTGILNYAVKATGFSSASELLHVKGPDVSEELIANIKPVSANESAVLTEEPAVVSLKKRGKDNSVDGSCNAELKSQSPPASPNDKVVKKAKREGKKGFKERAEAVCIPPEDAMDITLRRSYRKMNITQEYIVQEVLGDDKDEIRRSPRKSNAPQEATKPEAKVSDGNCAKESKKLKTTKVLVEPKVKSRKLQNEKDIINEIVEDIVLPSGCMMTNAAEIRRSLRKINVLQEAAKPKEKVSDENCAKETKKVKKTKVQVEPKVKPPKLPKEKDIIDEIVEDIVLPSGCMMTNMAEIRRSPSENNAPQEATKPEETVSDDNRAKETTKVKKTKVQVEPKVKSRKLQKEKDIIDEIVEDIVLPSGCVMTNVAGIALLPDDVGHALQFLEFCSTFGEVLQIQEGYAESVLRDIFCGRTMRRRKLSSTINFFIRILSFIRKDMPIEEEEDEDPSNDKDSWIRSLIICLAESELELEDFLELCFDKGLVGYEMLDPSQKLRLLTFLCDESLSVKEMRTWIKKQNLKFLKKEVEETESQFVEETESLNTASKKEAEEEVEWKPQENIDASILAQNGVPLTISDLDVISKLKAETKCACKELLEAMDVMPKKRQLSPVVRTDSVFLDDNGHAFWRLASLDDSNLLLQEVGLPEQIDYKDKWFSLNAEEMQVVDKYISSISQLKRYKCTKLADQIKTKSNSDIEVDSSSNDDTLRSIDDT